MVAVFASHTTGTIEQQQKQNVSAAHTVLIDGNCVFSRGVPFETPNGRSGTFDGSQKQRL
jgi:hypothetical protein